MTGAVRHVLQLRIDRGLLDDRRRAPAGGRERTPTGDGLSMASIDRSSHRYSNAMIPSAAMALYHYHHNNQDYRWRYLLQVKARSGAWVIVVKWASNPVGR